MACTECRLQRRVPRRRAQQLHVLRRRLAVPPRGGKPPRVSASTGLRPCRHGLAQQSIKGGCWGRERQHCPAGRPHRMPDQHSAWKVVDTCWSSTSNQSNPLDPGCRPQQHSGEPLRRAPAAGAQAVGQAPARLAVRGSDAQAGARGRGGLRMAAQRRERGRQVAQQRRARRLGHQRALVRAARRLRPALPAGARRPIEDRCGGARVRCLSPASLTPTRTTLGAPSSPHMRKPMPAPVVRAFARRLHPRSEAPPLGSDPASCRHKRHVGY